MQFAKNTPIYTVSGLPTYVQSTNFLPYLGIHPYNRSDYNPNNPYEHYEHFEYEISTKVKHTISSPRFSNIYGHIFLETTFDMISPSSRLLKPHVQDNRTSVSFFTFKVFDSRSNIRTEGGSRISFFSHSSYTIATTTIDLSPLRTDSIGASHTRFETKIRTHYDWLSIAIKILAIENIRDSFTHVRAAAHIDRDNNPNFKQFFTLSRRVLDWIDDYSLILAKAILTSIPQHACSINNTKNTKPTAISDNPNKFFVLERPMNPPQEAQL